MAGSSPLARGTRRRSAAPRGPHRFIPARAGNTCEPSKWRSSPTVHPRSRGEHPRDRNARGADDGSSPLARGTPALRRPRRRPGRFIPARAGNTRCAAARAAPAAVHPRSRGEHVSAPDQVGRQSGSSPLARGTRQDRAAGYGHGRFIPARAGNTGWPGPPASPSPVHPRSRGEHVRARISIESFRGSSPLARGTPEITLSELNGRRFIPARAGNTSRRPGSTAGPSVHPRSRGEHDLAGDLTDAVAGSSPLARGTHAGHGAAHEPERFIPARAGNTPSRPSGGPGWPVHPRSRGEHP